MQNSLYKLFEHKCVCTHPSYNDTNPPCGFLKIPILKSSQIRLFWDSSQNDLVLYKPLPWELTRPSYLRPDLSELRALRHCVDSGAGEDKMSPIKWFEVFSLVNNEYSSHHLLLTSEPLKRQRINVTFTLKWMCRSPIYINVSLFARIIRDPALSTEEVSIRVFMNLCKSPFLIMCLLASSAAEV